MSRRVIDVEDEVWEKLGEMAVQAKRVYRGKPNRSAQIEALVGNNEDAPPVPLAQEKTTVPYDDAVEGLSHYHQNVLLKQHPAQPAALKRFYDLVVGGGKQ